MIDVSLNFANSWRTSSDHSSRIFCRGNSDSADRVSRPRKYHLRGREATNQSFRVSSFARGERFHSVGAGRGGEHKGSLLKLWIACRHFSLLVYALGYVKEAVIPKSFVRCMHLQSCDRVARKATLRDALVRP